MPYAYVSSLASMIAERVPSIDATVWRGFTLAPVAPETLDRARGSIGRFELLSAEAAASRLATMIASTAALAENRLESMTAAASQALRLLADAKAITEQGPNDDFVVDVLESHLAAVDELIAAKPSANSRELGRLEALSRVGKASAPLAHAQPVREAMSRISTARQACDKQEAALASARLSLAQILDHARRTTPTGELAQLQAQFAEMGERIARLQGPSR